MKEEELVKKAKKKVKAKKEFYTHLGIYCATIFFLFILNFITSPQFWWFMIVAAGWGIGIVGHYLEVFGFPHPRGKDWEEDALRKEVMKLKQQEEMLDEDDTLDLKNHRTLTEYKRETLDYDDEEFV